jgi:outer membrane protein insertion porin family
MTVWSVIFLLLFPSTTLGQEQYYGSRVAELALSGVSNESDLQRIPLHIGDTITPQNVRASIQALYDTGQYAYIEVEASRVADGVLLTFQVRPHYFFSTIRLEPDNLLDRPISGFIRLPVGEKYSRTELDRIATETSDILTNEGYFGATVTPEASFDETTRLTSVVLRADVKSKAKIGAITINGGEETFTNREILDFFNVKPGSDFSSDKLEKGSSNIRAKFADLGFLSTAINVARTYDAATNTVDLSLTVQPGRFTLVQVRGYDISRKKLRELVPVYEEGTVDPDLVEEGRSQILAFLQQEGYFEATVEAEPIIEADLDNAVQINYNVNRGERHRIHSIRIVGNQYFTDDELKSRMRIRTAGLFNRSVFSTDALDQDVRTIQSMYRNAGFDGATVARRYEEKDHSLDIVIDIDEGQRHPLETVTFIGNSTVSTEELLARTGLEQGEIYTRTKVEAARSALTSLYYSKGFPDAQVQVNVERSPDDDGVHVMFQIEEGNAYNIGRIFVAGNRLTAEKIVHRNSNLYSGIPYNPEAILESQQRLYATGLFSRVDIVPFGEPTAGIRNLLIQVEDAKPILVTPGVGYQDREGIRGTIEVSHNNLFGLDRSISVRLRGSKTEQRFQSTYREPRLFNHNLEGFASLFVEQSHQVFYEASRIDFSVQTLKRISNAQNLLFTASYQAVNLQDILVNPRAEQFPDETGVIQIGRVGTSFIREHRDDPINPQKGTFNSTTFQVAARGLGSEVNFTSLFNQSSYYHPWAPGVLAASLRFGWNHPFGGTQLIPITERYFAGGSTTLRGFHQDEAFIGGGNSMVIANLEYRFPMPILGFKNLGGATFYDTGNAFRDLSDISLNDFTHSAGFGIRYQTPLGPIRLDLGFNLDPHIRADGQKEDRVKVFFTLGHTF